MLNALLGKVSRAPDGRIAGLLAVDINPSTATITELEYAAQPEAFARFPSGREERIPLDRLARFVAVAGDAPGALHDATGDDDSAPSFVIVRVDSPFLAGGFVVRRYARARLAESRAPGAPRSPICRAPTPCSI